MEQNQKISYSISSSVLKSPGRHFEAYEKAPNSPSSHMFKAASKLDIFDNFKNEYSKSYLLAK